jgi:hypothetical protein
MPEGRDRNFVVGVAAIAVGVALGVGGALWAHFTGLPPVDDVGRELYPAIPRGWGWELSGQLVSLGGVFLAIAGTALAFLYEKTMTWARAALGAFLFTALMIILYGIIPNQWLTYTQAVWEWTPQKLWIKVPTALLGGNEVNVSAAAIKDVVSGTYVVVVTGAVATAMIRWQKRDEYREARAKKAAAQEPTSVYGHALRKAER